MTTEAAPTRVQQLDVTVYFNPSCSNCQRALEILEENGVDPEVVRYLEQPPTRPELEDLMVKLGIDDPQEMMRSKEPVYSELGLAEADRDRLLDAIVEHPILLQRPIVSRGGKAVIARPPEALNQLF